MLAFGLFSTLGFATAAAQSPSDSPPTAVRARSADEFAYCDPDDEKLVLRDGFRRSNSVRYAVLELRPSSEQPTEVLLGRRAADDLFGLIRDHLVEVIAADAAAEDRQAIAQSIEVVHLRCVVQDDSAARLIGTTMGADVVLWGEASSTAPTPSGAPLVEVIINQANMASTGGVAHVGGMKAKVAPLSSKVLKELAAFTQGFFRVHATLTSGCLPALRSRGDERVVASQLGNLELPQIVAGDAYGLVVFVAGLHQYRQAEYSRALRLFRRASAKLRVDTPAAADLLWIMGDTEMRAGRFQDAARRFKDGVDHATTGSPIHWFHRLSLIDALVHSGQTAKANELATAASKELRRDDAQGPDASATRGMALNNLSACLAELGRWEEALAASEGAVEVCRRLAKARPEAFEPNLAMSLNNLSNRLSDLGRREEALAAIEGAVEVFRRRAKARPEAFEPTLAMSLNNLSLRLADLGRREDALAAIEGAVEIRRRLAKARPEAFDPDLAASLNNLSVHLAGLGRREEALAAIEGAVEVYRRLTKARPEAFEPYLAKSLNNLSPRLADLGRREEALAAIEGAVEIRRRLANARPVVFNRDLANSLKILSLLLRNLGREDEADAAQREAAAIP